LTIAGFAQVSFQEPLGMVDVAQLLDDTEGTVEFELFDSGTTRRGSSTYEYESMSNANLLVRNVESRNRTGHDLTIPRQIELTPQTILFFGLYIGDGAKSFRPGAPGTISLSQKESNISRFARARFLNLFGPSLRFVHSVNEDALYFMSDSIRQELSDLRHELLERGEDVMTDRELQTYLQRDLDTILSEQPPATQSAVRKYRRKSLFRRYRQYLPEFFANRPLMKLYLEDAKRRELEAAGIADENDKVTANVRLPGVKGARGPGKSSRSVELTVEGISPFRALFLRIISDTYSSIAGNSTTVSVSGSASPWIRWSGPPHTFARCEFDARRYLSDSASTVRMMAHRSRRYSLESSSGQILVSSGSKRFEVPRVLKLTPLVCLFSGLYLAEGATPKYKLFRYSEERVGGLNLALTASEDDTLRVCMEAIKSLVVGEMGVVQSWRLKIGAKYFPETVTIGNKMGVPLLRRGPKGQGAASGFEIVEGAKDWALKAMPSLRSVSQAFDHVEFTGAGIPRVDIFYDQALAVYLFSIMRNLVLDPSEFERFEV
jgi:hypothetical protein